MHKKSSLLFTLLFLSACAQAPKTSDPSAAKASPQEPVSQPVANPPAEPSAIAMAAKSLPAMQIPAPMGATAGPAISALPSPKAWHMKKGVLEGAVKRPLGRVVAKTANKKGKGFTTDTCYDYGAFAIYEIKSSDEVGSAEIYVRHKGEGAICAARFKGNQQNLKLREGVFAGVVGDYVVTEGADASEFLLESQIFSLTNGEEIFRVVHDPSQDYQLILSGPTLSAIYHSKINVKCELPTEGKDCWNKVVAQNKLPKSIRMPDCVSPYALKKTKLEEPALVTVKTRVSDVRKPKPEYLAGSASCAPEP